MFEKILKENHLKITPQRLAILKEIQKFGHISIDEIYENVKESNPSMSLATIYKNLASIKTNFTKIIFIYQERLSINNYTK